MHVVKQTDAIDKNRMCKRGGYLKKITLPPKAALIPLVLAILAFIYEVYAPDGEASPKIAKHTTDV